MTQLPVALKLSLSKYQKIIFKTTLKTKYNLVTGFTATGKTTFYNALRDRDDVVVDNMNNKWLAVKSIDSFLKPFTVDVVLVDENIATKLDYLLMSKKGEDRDLIRDNLYNATCKFIFINRGMRSLSIDYKSVYKLVNVSGILKPERLFPDYMNFNSTLDILTEDSKTGFEYYKHWFTNVRTSKGKNNLRKDATSSTQIVADGSALGYEVTVLERYNLYLPESFEYDLAKAWKPEDTKTLLSLEPDSSESVEHYFENSALPALCERYHLPRYTKNTKLNSELLSVQIHKNDKLCWCKENAPEALEGLPDIELLEIMNSAWKHRDT